MADPAPLTDRPAPLEMRDGFARRELTRAAIWLGLAAAMAVAVLLAVLPAFLIFQLNPLILAVGALPVIFLVSRSNRLASQYLEVEARFLANYNERKLAERFGGGEGEEVVHH